MDLSSIQAQLARKKLFASPVNLLMSRDGFGLTTATPVQQAIMATMGGQEPPIWDEVVAGAFGGVRPSPELLREILVMSGVRGGKAQPNEEPVLTPNGWSTMGQLRVGDEVIGSDGLPKKVLGVFPQGLRPLMRVGFTDGTYAMCDEEHLWTFRSYTKNEITRTAKEWSGRQFRRTTGRRGHTMALRTVAPVQFPERELPLDPYTLGALLGDGSMTHGLGFTSMDMDIVGNLVLPAGISLKKRRHQNSGRATDYAVTGNRGTKSPLLKILRELGLHGCDSSEKFIPPAYLLGSVQQRLALIQGLFDTDGHARRGKLVEYSTMSPRLADGVRELVESLGGMVRRVKAPRTNRMNCKLPDQLLAFRCSRKLKIHLGGVGKRHRGMWRQVASIEPAGTGNCTCIAIDSADHLYVTRHYLLTHNTFIAACAALWMSQTVRLDAGAGMFLRPGEMPRISIVSARVDQAKQAFEYLKGALVSSPVLEKLLMEKPLTESLIVRHPSGAPIEICLVATASAGTSLVARWCAGVIFDEAPRMASEQDGAAINLEEMVRAVRSRMLKGALIMYIGSPVGPVGYVYKLFTSFWQKGGRVQVIKAKGPEMNPYNWTPEKCQELLDSDPDAHRTDVLAEFRDAETAMYSSTSVHAAMRTEPKVLPPDDTKTYSAAMDPATRGNAWTLIIAETSDNVRASVALAMQWIGSQSEPLSGWDVLAEMKPILDSYRVQTVKTDQFAVDFIRDIALRLGFGISAIPFTGKNKMQMYESVRVRLDAGYLDLPPDEDLRNDLLSVKKRVTTGDPKVVLPETADGRHCDYAPALALLCGTYIEESKQPDKDERSQEQRLAQESEETALEWWEPSKETYGTEDNDFADWQ